MIRCLLVGALGQSFNLRLDGSAADLPFGDGRIDLGRVAGVAGPKTLFFHVFGPRWPLGTPGRSKSYVLRRQASF